MVSFINESNTLSPWKKVQRKQKARTVVSLDNRQLLLEIEKPSLKSKIRKILSALVSDPVELSVLLVDDRTIAELNTQYLNRRRPHQCAFLSNA